MHKKTKWVWCYLCLALLLVLIVGCERHRRSIRLPPVTEGWKQLAAGRNAYIVQKKDTLYSIAWAFGIDYRDLARSNNLNPPYLLRFGQRLKLLFKSASVVHSSTHSKFTDNIRVSSPIKGWLWPTHGTIVKGFDSKLGGNKGVDIKGSYGSLILASNSGKVVYSGMGIPSYGKLIIIKHNDDYLSAYAYNKSMLVQEGQLVSAGQKIATMGNNDAGDVRLHFEIRRIGKPINPLLYLPKKS